MLILCGERLDDPPKQRSGFLGPGSSPPLPTSLLPRGPRALLDPTTWAQHPQPCPGCCSSGMLRSTARSQGDLLGPGLSSCWDGRAGRAGGCGVLRVGSLLLLISLWLLGGSAPLTGPGAGAHAAGEFCQGGVTADLRGSAGRHS